MALGVVELVLGGQIMLVGRFDLAVECFQCGLLFVAVAVVFPCQGQLALALLPFFAEKAALTATAAARMSETQRMKVSEEFERRVLAGEAGGHHLDAILADANTFGIDAVIRR